MTGIKIGIGAAGILACVAVGSAEAGDGIVAGDRAIVETRVVGVSAADAWRAWTTDEGLESFFGADCTVELRPGGPFEILFSTDAPEGSRGSEGCTVLSYLPERMLSFSWNAPPSFPEIRAGDHETIVVVEFTPLGDTHTSVTLRHHGWPDESTTTDQWDGVFEYFSRAWPSVMDSFAGTMGAGDETASDPRNGWMYIFTEFTRPDFLETITPEEEATFGRHFVRLQALTREGKVLFAGPSLDGSGVGIVIFHASTADEAEAFMKADPIVAEGIVKVKLYPMRFSLVRDLDS